MIRYAVLTPSLAQPGGAERHIHALIAHADPARLRCVGVVLSGYGGADPDLCRAILARGVAITGDAQKESGFPPRPPGLVYAPHATLGDAVREACRAADVLVTWGSLVMGRFTEGVGIPVVCVSHCAEEAGRAVTGITHLVGVSRAATEFWAGVAHGLPVDIIPNGVEVEHCVPRRGRARQRADWGVADRVVVGYVGRQHPIKRPWACIEALAILPERYAAVLVGGRADDQPGPEPYLQDRAAQLGVAPRVRFVPRRAHMGDAYAALDCLMLASVREADSLTLKEAMVCGLPACATRVGSVPELEAEFGVGEAVVPILDGDDPVALAAAARLATGPDGRRIADRMRRVAWDRWTAPAMAERWADYLERIVHA